MSIHLHTKTPSNNQNFFSTLFPSELPYDTADPNVIPMADTQSPIVPPTCLREGKQQSGLDDDCQTPSVTD